MKTIRKLIYWAITPLLMLGLLIALALLFVAALCAETDREGK